MLLGGHFLFTF